MDWSRNNKDTSLTEKAARSIETKKTKTDEVTLKELGQQGFAKTPAINEDALNIIKEKRGLKNVNANDVTESRVQARERDSNLERILDNSRNNKVEKGGAEEDNNSQVNVKNAQEKSNQIRLQEGGIRESLAKRMMKRRGLSMSKGIKNKALTTVRNNPTANNKAMEKAAKDRTKAARKGLSVSKLKDSKYYKAFAEYFGKKTSKEKQQEEQNKVKKLEKAQIKRLKLLKEKSGRGTHRTVKKVDRREISQENIKAILIARERTPQKE